MGALGSVAIIFYVFAVLLAVAGVTMSEYRTLFWISALSLFVLGLVLTAANQVAGEIIKNLEAIRTELKSKEK